MPLSERTERALDACQDAVLAPQQWPRALQLLAESLGAASCTLFYPDDPKASVPISSEHVEFADLWIRNQDDFPDPHLKIMPEWEGYSWIVADQSSTSEAHRLTPCPPETAP